MPKDGSIIFLRFKINHLRSNIDQVEIKPLIIPRFELTSSRMLPTDNYENIGTIVECLELQWNSSRLFNYWLLLLFTSSSRCQV